MTHTETQIIKSNITGQLKNKLIAPLIVVGSPGTGKSNTIKQLAKDLEMNLVEYSMPSCTIEKLSGLPTEFATPELNKATVFDIGRDAHSTVWSIPEMIADCCREALTGPTILLLDDFHGMAQHLQSYFYELLLERKMGNYKLPSNVAIVGTMNNSSEAGFSGVNSAVLNRLAFLKVSFNFEYWFDGFGKRLNYYVASFLKVKSTCIESPESTDEPYSTARSWTALAYELDGHQPQFIIDNAQTLASMYISQAHAQSFATHVNMISAIDFQSVMDNKTMLDLASRPPEDAIICSYIARFVNSAADGLHLLDLLMHNIAKRSFVGFTSAELYDYYKNADKQTEGIALAIDLILGRPTTVTSKLTKDQQARLEYYTQNKPTAITNIAKDYL